VGSASYAENKLTRITIPNSVRTIGDKAFAYSFKGRNKSILDKPEEFNKITEITIGENVKIIDNSERYEGSTDKYFNKFWQVYRMNGGKAGTYTYGFLGWNKK